MTLVTQVSDFVMPCHFCCHRGSWASHSHLQLETSEVQTVAITLAPNFTLSWKGGERECSDEGVWLGPEHPLTWLGVGWRAVLLLTALFHRTQDTRDRWAARIHVRL